MQSRFILLLLMLNLLLPVNLLAGVEVHEFASAEQEQQFKKLVNELRCLVCQNQNLADSNSELAQDLRKEVFGMIQKGDTETDIINFMVERYGDFVLYRPPFKPVTFLLWLGPFLLSVVATGFLIMFIRNNKKNLPAELSPEDAEKLKQLLNNNSDQEHK